MAFIRRVRTASGATAVQIAEYAGGRQRILKHVGSAHTEAELGVLLERARELLADPGQAMLNLGVEPTPPVQALAAPPGEPALVDHPTHGRRGGGDGAGRVVATDRACCTTRWAASTRRSGSTPWVMRRSATW